jgi:phosphatidylserine/phosphatidylglycerophosphate/cardiolipin synthase-like enzyme
MTYETNPIFPDSHRRFYGAKAAALYCIQQALSEAELVRIATAYFEASGYQVLQETLFGKRIHLLVGRDQGGRDNVTDVIDEFEHELSSGNMERRTKAMRMMLEALEKKMMVVSVGEEPIDDLAIMDARYLYHHAKLYIADQKAAVVGSANFSYHGLVTSREAGITITDPDDVNFFVQRFDDYFNKAQSITQALIDKILAWLKQYDPFLI